MIDRKELVEKMIGAWFESANCNEVRMDRALSVAIEELLRDNDGLASYLPEFVQYKHGSLTLTEALNIFLASRRAQLERVKTPAERVMVGATSEHWLVYFDGGEHVHFCKAQFTRETRDVYRLGLIAKLTAELPKNQ